jgi:hypothetical protein
MNNFQQLSLFPETQTQSRQLSPKSKAVALIELQCSTKRAANLLEISPSTLNRAKQQGKLPYQHGPWMVDISGKNGKKRLYWKVLHSR